MNLEEFKQQVMEDLPGALPERLSNVEIEPVSVTKLQHGSYAGITIREEGSNIGMNLDMSGLYAEKSVILMYKWDRENILTNKWVICYIYKCVIYYLLRGRKNEQ